MLTSRALLLLFSFLVMGTARAETALVGVATNFAEPAKEIGLLFERQNHHRIQFTIASTGKLYAQIITGAMIHALLSADSATPKRLANEGFAIESTRRTYAIGRLTLWSANKDLIGNDGRSALTDKAVLHIAMANPELAPYGAAARETLQNLKLWDSLLKKIVFGENIGQTYALIATENAQLGFVALSSVRNLDTGKKGSRWDVPPSLYTPIRQDAILLLAGTENPAAKDFLNFLKLEPAHKIIEQYGYGVD